jgi:hypothetical protein
MPMIDLTLPAGVLDKEQKDALAGELTRTLLQYEGAGRDNEIAAQIAWAYLDEREPGTIYAAHVRPSSRATACSSPCPRARSTTSGRPRSCAP